MARKVTKAAGSQIKLERGIPIPENSRERGGLTTLMRQMEVGDSFLWPRMRLSNAWVTAKRLGIKLTSKGESATHTRVWRIK